MSVPTQEPPDDANPAVRLGRKLREARLAAGYRSQQAFATDLNTHRTTVAKIENGTRHVTLSMLRRWCELCHVDYELYEASVRLAWSAETAPVPPWFADFRQAQVMAHTIRTWHPSIIPGLLQTPDYSRSLHEGAGTPDELIAERVAARLDLQQQTIDRTPPVGLLAVMDEAALHRYVGPDAIMRAQLAHLVELGQRKHVGIQVVPARRGANAGHVGAFTIASMDDADVMLMDAVQDVTTDQRAMLRTALTIFDRVRLDAHSQVESLGLISEVAERYKP
jgi:transcriptional regulator with XRE-family HTH domain